MSHEATNWAIAQRGHELSAVTKLVLWHLADCHNPVHGCFPTQEFLADRCEIARSTVNRCLDDLETKGLIRRVARVSAVTRRQLATRYFLACEKGFEPQDVAGRVPRSDTDGAGPAGAEDDEPAVENPPSRVPKTGVSVSDSYGTQTFKEPVSPLPPDEELFEQLVKKWPDDRLGSLGKAEEAFERLSCADRAKAVELADAFRAGFYALKRSLPQLSAYCGARQFSEFDNPPPIEQGSFRVTPARPEWSDWLGWVRRHHKQAGVERVVRRGFFLVQTRWPTDRPRSNQKETA